MHVAQLGDDGQLLEQNSHQVHHSGICSMFSMATKRKSMMCRIQESAVLALKLVHEVGTIVLIARL